MKGKIWDLVWDLVMLMVYVAFFFIVLANKAYTTFYDGLIEDVEGIDQVAAGDFAMMATMIGFVIGLVCMYKMPLLFGNRGEK